MSACFTENADQWDSTGNADGADGTWHAALGMEWNHSESFVALRLELGPADMKRSWTEQEMFARSGTTSEI